MNQERQDQQLRDLYAGALATGGPAAGGPHATPEAIAALARREGGEDERLATLDHVMSCAGCRRDFDLLRAVEAAGADRGAAGRGLARHSWRGPLALAAGLLLAVGLGSLVLRPAEDTTRGETSETVTLVQPGPSAAAGSALDFVWRPVPNARSYQLELLDSAGNVAASATTADTLAAPEAVRALPAGDYRWWVRASTSDARALRSPLRPLRLTAQ